MVRPPSPKTIFKRDKVSISKIESFFSDLKTPFPDPPKPASPKNFYRFVKPRDLSVRERAKSVLEKTLMKYMTSNLKVEEEDAECITYAVAVASELETEIHKLHPSVAPYTFPTKDYMNKIKAIKSNLDNPKNLLLCGRVLTGDIPLSKLASMTGRDLASEEMKKFRNEREEAYTKNRVFGAEDSTAEGVVDGGEHDDGVGVAASRGDAEAPKPKAPGPAPPSMPLLPSQPIFRPPPKVKQLPRLPDSPPSSPPSPRRGKRTSSSSSSASEKRDKRKKQRRTSGRSDDDDDDDDEADSVAPLISEEGSALMYSLIKCKDDYESSFEMKYLSDREKSFKFHLEVPVLRQRIPSNISKHLKSKFEVNRPRHKDCVDFLKKKMQTGRYELVPLKINVDRCDETDRKNFARVCKDLEDNGKIGLVATKKEQIKFYLVPPALTTFYDCLKEVTLKGKAGTMWGIYVVNKKEIKWRTAQNQNSNAPHLRGATAPSSPSRFPHGPPPTANTTASSFDSIDINSIQSSLSMLQGGRPAAPTTASASMQSFDALPQSFDMLPPQNALHNPDHQQWQQPWPHANPPRPMAPRPPPRLQPPHSGVQHGYYPTPPYHQPPAR